MQLVSLVVGFLPRSHHKEHTCLGVSLDIEILCGYCVWMFWFHSVRVLPGNLLQKGYIEAAEDICKGMTEWLRRWAQGQKDVKAE